LQDHRRLEQRAGERRGRRIDHERLDITGNLTVSLLAERSGTGPGGNHTVTVRCTDISGNSTIAKALVTVPHDSWR